MDLYSQYRSIRQATELICRPLEKEDYVVQPIVDVSPPKWHLGHTTWFFENFLLKQYLSDYRPFHPGFDFVFNSYYETLGARVIRTDRGNLSRPTVDQLYEYRSHVDAAMGHLLQSTKADQPELQEILLLGLNHEQQHQELLWTDIKYILGHNPLFPKYADKYPHPTPLEQEQILHTIEEGVYEIGHGDEGFCFDNELGRHKVFLPSFSISSRLVTNEEYLEFIEAGGYSQFQHWHSEGWEWVKQSGVRAPLYWHWIDNNWMVYTLGGLKPLQLKDPVIHINYFEAAAFASWNGKRLPTEMEWEVASDLLFRGDCWEWTNSAYLPYPGYKRAPGAIGEYNGKFMINQMVLRGGSVATSPGHIRKTYRNFFHPHLRWQFTGIRLVTEL